MKRNFFIFLLFLNITSVNAYAFSFNVTETKKNNVSSIEENQSIYCDINAHWCKESAEELFKDDVFKGIKIGGNYYFMPDEPVTRGEFLLYLNAVLNIPTDSNKVFLPFNDTKLIPSWQYPTVGLMYQKGYIKGNLEKTGLFFNGDEKISRLECTLILNNIFKPAKNSKPLSYSDEYLIPTYARTAVENITERNLIKGYDDNSFRPYIKITRGMLADILCRIKKLPNTQIDKLP